MMIAFARLKPGIKLEQAQADLSVAASQIERAYPEAYPRQDGYTLSAVPLQDDLTHTARTTFFVLLAGAGFVLLIACANVANLMLARLLRVEREMAVRAALGASKSRLLRQLLSESIIISLTGGLLGLALAPLTLSVLVKFAARYTTRAAEVNIDAPVLLFTFVIALGTGIVFGLAPAFSSSWRAADALKQGNGRTTSGSRHQTLRASLVVAQMAVSFILLIGAGLMLRSLIKLTQVNPGFRTDHLLSMRLTPNFANYTQSPSQLPTLSDNIMRRVKEISGIKSASFVSNVPLSPTGIASGPGNVAFTIAGRPAAPANLGPAVDITIADSDYFQTIGQPLIAGRVFSQHDEATGLRVAVINQTMARHRWQSEDPIGQRIAFNFQPDQWITIVGVVNDTREYGLASPTKDEMYLPMAQQGGFTSHLIVRTSYDPSVATPLIRAAIHRVDPFIALDQIATLEHFQYESMAPPRVTARLLGLFAALALLISSGGIAAVMTVSVTQRTRELGIRMALGAQRKTIVAMVMREGLMLASLGIVVGICGALALTRLLSTLLYATNPTDVPTFLAVSFLFLTVGLIACFVPAHQVTVIDPLIAVREE
jgi:putative ABC transport system permease protein